jgi:tetratricopeptide (TPR) repeat protein
MTGSFPIFGQPVWDEGLQGREWIRTIETLTALKPAHIIPGHGTLAYEPEIKLLIRIQEYFLEEIAKLIAKGYSVTQVLADLEPRLPQWITSIPLVWGTPRYAILRVYRGLTRKPSESHVGWQVVKPSAIPSSEISVVTQKTAAFKGFEEYKNLAHEASEGGDAALRLSVLKKAAEIFRNDAEAQCAYADALIEESRKEASVLEKGDFFMEARRTWDRVLAEKPDHIGALLGKGRYLTMMAYRGGDDPKEGMRLLRKALELNPSPDAKTEIEFYLGMGLRRLGDETAAKAQFKKSLDLNPGFMPAFLAGLV